MSKEEKRASCKKLAPIFGNLFDSIHKKVI